MKADRLLIGIAAALVYLVIASRLNPPAPTARPPIRSQPPIEVPSTPQTSDPAKGYEAGYQWARENDIDDLHDCSGESESFIKGCHSYAEDHRRPF